MWPFSLFSCPVATFGPNSAKWLGLSMSKAFRYSEGLTTSYTVQCVTESTWAPCSSFPCPVLLDCWVRLHFSWIPFYMDSCTSKTSSHWTTPPTAHKCISNRCSMWECITGCTDSALCSLFSSWSPFYDSPWVTWWLQRISKPFAATVSLSRARRWRK